MGNQPSCCVAGDGAGMSFGEDGRVQLPDQDELAELFEYWDPDGTGKMSWREVGKAANQLWGPDVDAWVRTELKNRMRKSGCDHMGKRCVRLPQFRELLDQAVQSVRDRAREMTYEPSAMSRRREYEEMTEKQLRRACATWGRPRPAR